MPRNNLDLPDNLSNVVSETRRSRKSAPVRYAPFLASMDKLKRKHVLRENNVMKKGFTENSPPLTRQRLSEHNADSSIENPFEDQMWKVPCDSAPQRPQRVSTPVRNRLSPGRRPVRSPSPSLSGCSEIDDIHDRSRSIIVPSATRLHRNRAYDSRYDPSIEIRQVEQRLTKYNSKDWAVETELYDELQEDMIKYTEKLRKRKSEKCPESKIEMETDSGVLTRRQKDIDMGKSLEDYVQYVQNVPKPRRLLNHPRTPNKFLKMSRRAWDGAIRKWKKHIHNWQDMNFSNTYRNESMSTSTSDISEIRDTDSVSSMRSSLKGGHESSSRYSLSHDSNFSPSFSSRGNSRRSSDAAPLMSLQVSKPSSMRKSRVLDEDRERRRFSLRDNKPDHDEDTLQEINTKTNTHSVKHCSAFFDLGDDAMTGFPDIRMTRSQAIMQKKNKVSSSGPEMDVLHTGLTNDMAAVSHRTPTKRLSDLTNDIGMSPNKRLRRSSGKDKQSSNNGVSYAGVVTKPTVARLPFAGSEEFILDLKNRQYLNGEKQFVKLRGYDVTAAHFIRNGFDAPVLVPTIEGLGLKMPHTSFTLADVEDFVGMNFEIDVIDVRKQSDEHMTLREFLRYFFAPVRTRLLNVLSLEFSSTRLSKLVSPPQVVRDLSLVEKYWPVEDDLDLTNEETMWSRPSVQKYCLMSMAESYTDFHIDFGGSSVWYHVLWGEKIFYLVPATPTNLTAYQRWYSLDNHNHVFFPEFLERHIHMKKSLLKESYQGEEEARVYKLSVRTGQTVLLPAGWIHAVYTPVDSLVFGGNFLHELGIPQQISIYRMEIKLKTETRFLFPHFEKLHWYVSEALLSKFKNYLLHKRTPPAHYINGVQCLVKTLELWLEKRKSLPLSERHLFLPKRQFMELSYSELIGQLRFVLDRLGYSEVKKEKIESPQENKPRKGNRIRKRKRDDSFVTLDNKEEPVFKDDVKDEDYDETEEALPDLKDATLIGEHYYFPAGADSDDERKKKSKRKRSKASTSHNSAKPNISEIVTGGRLEPGTSRVCPVPGSSKSSTSSASQKVKTKRIKKSEATPQQRLAKKLGIVRRF